MRFPAALRALSAALLLAAAAAPAVAVVPPGPLRPMPPALERRLSALAGRVAEMPPDAAAERPFDAAVRHSSGGGGGGSHADEHSAVTPQPGGGHSDDDHDDEEGEHEPHEPKCRNKHPPGAARTFAGSFVGPLSEAVYEDPNNSFFRFALGWDSARIHNETAEAMAALNYTYGLTEGTPGLSTGVIVYDIVLRVVSRSDGPTPCADSITYIGGFFAAGNNVSYGGAFGRVATGKDGGRVTIPGDSSVVTLFVVVNPGMPSVLKFKWGTTTPSSCSVVGACVLTGDVETVDADSPFVASGDGMFVPVLFGDKLGYGVTVSFLIPRHLRPETGPAMGM